MGFFLGAKFGSIRNSLSRFHPIDKIFGWIFLRLTAKHRVRNWKEAIDRITRRLEMGDVGRQDFLSPILDDIAHSNNLEEVKQKGVTRQEVNTHGLSVVIAGCQLSTVALATATYLLLRYPSTLKLLQEELRTHFKAEEEISVASTEKLPYLSAVLDEALRIHHPTPINLPRVVQDGGIVVDGQQIPAGVSDWCIYLLFLGIS